MLSRATSALVQQMWMQTKLRGNRWHCGRRWSGTMLTWIFSWTVKYVEVADLKETAPFEWNYKIFFDGFSKIFMLGGIHITFCILLGMQPAQDSWKLQGKYFKRFQGLCVRMSHGHLARWMGSWTTIWRPGCNKFANIQQDLRGAARITWVSMVSISDAY